MHRRVISLAMMLGAACSADRPDDDPPSAGNDLATVAAPAAPSPAQSPLLTYDVAGQTAFMQALSGGVLTLDGGCVYIVNAGGRALLVLPDPPTRWNADRGTIQFGERELRFGDEVAFGGGEGGSIAPGPVADAARRKGCDTSRVWWASPELVTPRRLPQAMPPPGAEQL